MKITKTFKYCSKCDKVIYVEGIDESKECSDSKDCPMLDKIKPQKSRLDWNFTKYVTPRKMD